MKIRVKSKDEIVKEYRDSLKKEYKVREFILVAILMIGIGILMFGLIEAELWVASLIDSIIK